jgi:hypothetical protein
MCRSHSYEDTGTSKKEYDTVNSLNSPAPIRKTGKTNHFEFQIFRPGVLWTLKAASHIILCQEKF